MSRRTVAGLLALGLIAVLVVVGISLPVPYVTDRPGPTVNVLGKYGGKDIIEVTGHPVYRDGGQLRMVTVYQSGPKDRISLLEMLMAWADPEVAAIPRDVVYPDKNTTEKQVQQQSAAEMTSSQDNATAAALTALGIDYRTEVVIADVAKDGPSYQKLRKGDILLAVNGKGAGTGIKMVDQIRAVKPGTPITLTIRRAGTERQVTVTTEPAADDKTASRINVAIKLDYVFPFKVGIRLSDNIGGPSAGMMFALSLYDVLTPGSLTGGKVIAGSGEIAPDGTVSPIGGIGQKIAGAQRDGARLFLVAQENCAEAARAHYDKKKIRLVRVHTLSEAIKDVQTWREDPNATLPRCTR
jgi:PDZ domain-containing protein